MGKPKVKESEETGRQINSDTKCNSKQQEVVENANERPDWLPDGWSVLVRIRKSGTQMGSSYKCYIDPLKGLKFFSKPEVLRHLETVKDSNCTPEKGKKRTNMHSPSNILDNLTSKDSSCTPKKEKKCTNMPSPSKILDNITSKDSSCTPKKEKKCTNMPSPSKILDNITTKDSTCTPKKEKKCTNIPSPSNIIDSITTKDSTCTPKKDKKCTNMPSPSNIIDNITTKDSTCTPKKEKKCTNMPSPSNVVVDKSTVEDLPPGWIKEVKIRKSRNNTKKDPYYKDPVSGYVFRSKKDVLRYLESGDIGSCVFKPHRSQIQNEDNLTPSRAGKRQNLKQSASKQQLFVAKKLVDKSSLESADVSNSRKGQDRDVPSGINENKCESVVKVHSPEDGAANRPEIPDPGSSAVLKYESMKKSENCADGVHEKEHVLNMMENTNDKNHNNHRTSKNKEFNVRHRSSPRLAGAVPVQMANNVINEQTLQVPKRSLRNSRSTQDVDMGSKSSQHFNGIPDKMQQVAVNTGTDLSADQVVSKEQHQLERDNTEDNKPGIRANSNKSRKKKGHCVPRRASNRLAGLKQSEGRPVTELVDHAPINGESGSRRIESPKIPPTADNQLEKHEDGEMEDEKSEPQLSFAFHYSWSDPSVEFAINTLTARSKDNENNSVDKGPTTVPATDIQNEVSGNVTGRSRNNQNNSVDNGPTTISETDINKTLFDNVTARSQDNQNNSLDKGTGSRDRSPQVHSNKSKRKKEVKVPMRLSKRLAGVEPDVPPSERALEYSTKKSRKEPTATATPILTDRASNSGHLDAGGKTKHMNTSDSLETEVLAESSNKSEKSYNAQTVRKKQLQQAVAENIGDERSEPQVSLPFGDSWPDPCLDFAFKTLSGALPVDSATDILPVMTPAVYEPPNKELHGRMVMGVNGEAHNNTNQCRNKKDVNMDGQPPKPFLGQPELRTSFTSYANAPKFTSGESHNDEANMIRGWNGEPLHFEAGNGKQPVHHPRGSIHTQVHGEPLQKNGQVVEGEFGTAARPPPQTETFDLNQDNTEFEFCASFMNSWSEDPCLEFAYKTLTGEIPVEENVATQGCIQQPASRNEKRDDGLTLPDFGFSSFSQSDISFQYDIGMMSMPGQQSSSMSSSFPSTENASQQGYPPGFGPQKYPPGFDPQKYPPGFVPQKYHPQYNKNFQSR
ncbi:methyl-CpG-binding domain-containing protein 13-like isoform X3 [Lotus japonicus]|uniref:methyl-CpG-binding domain-containing protein 13-like isoform X3 n=1 Tax=Lotus japonicus TaxID=34305 RepID=UPI0025879C90|nr:methyl-CpG-binding domain-containing protein 13-like isoform X3 [Lotus japonicus]